ncbi:hypothetical protein OG735_20490 [Streptomyces sp. NBC_01210]|nr:hypothetical protein OG735_20490 [Streptomyces sp. NBC_01210]
MAAADHGDGQRHHEHGAEHQRLRGGLVLEVTMQLVTLYGSTSPMQ